MLQFVTVAELRSFRRAAERLHMAQPPLSQAIRRLERDLDVVLLKRSSRSVDLTEAGKAFLSEVRYTLASADAAVVAARQAARGRVGRVRIGFTTPWAYDVVLKTVAAYRQQFERVSLSLREEPSSSQVRMLLEGAIDVGFVRLPYRHAVKELSTLPIRHDALCIILPGDHALATARRLDLQRLNREVFVLPPPTPEQGTEEISLRAQIAGLCAEAGFVPRVAQEARHMETIVRLVDAGLGVGLVPAWTQRQWSTRAVYVKLQSRSSLSRLTLAAAWSATPPSAALANFIATTRRLAREVRWLHSGVAAYESSPSSGRS